MTCRIIRRHGGKTTYHKNLGWIHRHTEGIWRVYLDQVKNEKGGILLISFHNGNVYYADFADWEVLKSHVRCWRNLEHARVNLCINMKDCGVVFSKHPDLMP